MVDETLKFFSEKDKTSFWTFDPLIVDSLSFEIWLEKELVLKAEDVDETESADEVEDEEGEVKQYRIVGCDEFDPAKNWISIDSPVARALIGKGVDDEIHVETPSGKVVLYVNRIWYEK